MYKTTSDWTRNKKSAAIIYADATGNITEITLARFLADSPENTIEQFQRLKALSDMLFHAEDKSEREQADLETPLEYVSAEYAAPSAEDVVCNADEETCQAYIKRKTKMAALVPHVLDKLTPVQRKRYLLHFGDGLTTRRIAEIDGVSHVAVIDSLAAAQKKIEKFLSKEAQL